MLNHCGEFGAAYWAGHTRPQDSLRLWQKVTALVTERGVMRPPVP